MKIVIIGAGNTATALGRRIREAGHEIIQVIGRSEPHARALAAELGCAYTIALDQIDGSADLYLVAIPDDAVEDLCGRLSLPGRLVTHTAGSLPTEALEKISLRHGVIYPLQRLRKEIPEIPELPLLINGNSAETLTRIAAFASTLSDRVQVAADGTRFGLHLAATILNNFTNHLYALTARFCEQERLDFQLLLPLARETVKTLDQFEPARMQTGPAIRNDRITLQNHLRKLEPYPGLQGLYEALTQSIRQFYGIKE